eukprot:CAMPEP_0175766320 /NCGR_PEP_ID=MMETSP0097-20121207/69303_1 /TAXON_ID=311494 /ORGANISM="Alexandrium monilatum, Strain CCMP3105" /LENGTH=61 /DNA_ID=CAMNT_0017076299 /DNA_START=10 /DNA_END=192 /DNA_ORIENTATION=-
MHKQHKDCRRLDSPCAKEESVNAHWWIYKIPVQQTRRGLHTPDGTPHLSIEVNAFTPSCGM